MSGEGLKAFGWTKEKPTKTGWYWVCSVGDDAEIVRVVNRHSLGFKGLSVEIGGELESLDLFAPHCRWFGPISAPGSEPTPDAALREAAEIHPDPLIAREVEMDYLQGLLSEARGALKRALDYKAATPEALEIKRDIRSGLDRIGWDETPSLATHPRSQEGA